MWKCHIRARSHGWASGCFHSPAVGSHAALTWPYSSQQAPSRAPISYRSFQASRFFLQLKSKAYLFQTLE